MKFHLAVAIAVVFGAASLQAAGRPACTVPLTVGFRVVTFGSIKTGVWYPATTAEASFNYFPATVGSISFNAAPATCGSFPMVVFSHGYTGCGTQAVFLTEELARNGFLVAAPDHSDAGCGVDGTFVAHPNAPGGPQSPYDWTDRTLANRRGDIAAVITAMLSSADFGPSIDPLRIAGMGHSFGGYTIQGMVGGWSSWVDPRIRAALLLSPYSEPFLVQSTLSGLRAPVMYQGGTQDSGITPYISQPGGSFDSTPAPRFFVEFAGASHQLWTNYTCDLSGTVALCLATVPNAKMVVDYATAFLKRYLNEANEPLLWVAASDVPDYRHVSLATTVSAAGFRAGSPVAPSSLVAVFGEGFGTDAAVNVLDSAGLAHAAKVIFASANQINVLLPAEIAVGPARLLVNVGASLVGQGNVKVAVVAPSLFTASVQGAAAGQSVTLSQSTPLADATGAPMPVDLGGADVYLVLYGTGIRAGTASVHARIGSLSAPVYYAGPQNQYAGLDQVTLGPLPRALAGIGTATVALTVADVNANPVLVAFH